MDLDFYKIQTAGNDLILVNFTGGLIPEDRHLAAIAVKLCRRDYGIGGNGFIAVTEFSAGGISARYICPSGDFTDNSYDAVTCLAKYAFDSGLAGSSDFNLIINGREHRIGVIDSRNFRFSLGKPSDGNGDPLIEDPDRDYSEIISSAGKDFPSTRLQLGREGRVVFSEYRNISQLKDISDEILKSPAPQSGRAGGGSGRELIFATVNSRDEIVVHIRNSRGADFVSCCAIAAAAAVVNGFTDHSAGILHKKAEYYFQWLQPSNEIFITASADYIFTGSIFVPVDGD